LAGALQPSRVPSLLIYVAASSGLGKDPWEQARHVVRAGLRQAASRSNPGYVLWVMAHRFGYRRRTQVCRIKEQLLC
jgi:hypothetical protein